MTGGARKREPRKLPATTSGLAPRVGSLTGGDAAAVVAPRGSGGRRGRKGGTTRSWYLDNDVADELAAATDRLYFDLRGQMEKREILGVLIRLGLNNMAKVRRHFKLPPDPPVDATTA